MVRAFQWVAALSLVLGGAACGSDDGQSATGSATIGASSSSGAGGAGGATASSAEASSSVAVGPSVSASSGAGPSSSAMSSSSGGDPGKAIPCGNFTCPEVCCLSLATKQCGASADECKQVNLSAMSCNDKSDCGMDQVCCLEMSFMVGVEGKCTASCPYKPLDMSNPSAATYQLCVATDECPQGTSCKDFKFNGMDTGWDACLP